MRNSAGENNGETMDNHNQPHETDDLWGIGSYQERNTGSSRYVLSSVTLSRPIKSSAMRCVTPGSIRMAVIRCREVKLCTPAWPGSISVQFGERQVIRKRWIGPDQWRR